MPAFRFPQLRPLLFIFAALALALALHLPRETVVDRDALYHVRHAALYWERGPFFADFPWTAFSVISQERSDLWYGFHILLSPLGTLADPLLALRLAGAAVLAAALLLLYWAFARLGLRFPEVWTAVLVFGGPPGLLRMLVIRPHVLTVGLLALLFSFLVRGRARHAAVVAALLAWVHLNLAALALAVTAAVLGFDALFHRRFRWQAAVAVVLGLLAGWLCRPNPIGAAKLLWVQLGVLSQAQAEHLPLLYGGELHPVLPEDLLLRFAPFVLLWIGAALLGLRRGALPEEDRPAAAAAGFLSLLCFGLAVQHMLRWSDLWRIFAVFLAAVMLERSRLPERQRRWVPAAVAVLVLWMGVALALPANRGIFTQGFSPTRLRGAAGWLREHSEPDAIVFHARWEAFAELFFWNTRNRYINGMDPVFLYAASPARYWEMHHLALGASRVTAAGPEPAEYNVDYTLNVLRRDFEARYFLVEADQRDLLYFARNTPGFRLEYQDAQAAVFTVLPAPPSR